MQKLLQMHNAPVPREKKSGEVQRRRRPGNHHLRRNPHAPNARVPPPLRRVLWRPAARFGRRPLPGPPGPRLPSPALTPGIRPRLPATSHCSPQHPIRPAAQSEPQPELTPRIKLHPTATTTATTAAGAQKLGVPAR